MSSKRSVIATSKITRGFQVTVAKKVREKFSFKEGDLLLFIEENGKLLIEKA